MENDIFKMFAETATKNIKIDALNGASIEIKTALTIAENEVIAGIRYKNQIILEDGKVGINQADFIASKIKTVSL